MNSVLSCIARFLHNVNANYKLRFQGLKASDSRTIFSFVNLYVYRLADITVIAGFYWNAFIIYQYCIFVHGNLFAVAFRMLANVIFRNVISVFKNLYVNMLEIVR